MNARPWLCALLAVGALACADGKRGSGRDAAGGDLGVGGDLGLGGDLGADDLGGAGDLSHADLRPSGDLASASDLASSGGVISGGPCLSGAGGATAFRVRWSNGAGTATPVYEAFGLPDHARDHVGAYGYGIGFSPSYVDPYLAQGGLQLDGSDFVDIELSTVGLSQIRSATLSLYGRSYDTTTSGSFNWQTFDGLGATPSDFVANSAPYQWYSADFLSEISPGDNGVLIRIKAGPSSGALVVNRIEICLDAS